MATQNKTTLGYKDGAYSLPVAGMSVGDILTGNNYDLTTARNRIPFVNNWTSALFATMKSLYANYVPDEAYALYKQQEREIIATAETNAAVIRAKGEVELRNLQYQHDKAMGTDIIKVSGSGGNMSGSFLDALMQQRKYQMLDEKTVVTNTENQVAAVLKEGYRNAANVAMQAQVTAQKQKQGVVGALMAGLDKYFELSFRDKAEAARQDAANEKLERSKENFENDRLARRGKLGSDEEKFNPFKLDYKNGKHEWNIINPLDLGRSSFGEYEIDKSQFSVLGGSETQQSSGLFSVLGGSETQQSNGLSFKNSIFTND